MNLYTKEIDYKLYHGSMLDMLQVLESESIDCIVTDPPYELNFMGKGWDNAGISFSKNTWKNCLEVLKDGGYLLAFGGSRTYHRIACAIEDAGFEVRDCIMWLYGTGFPKSTGIKLEAWQGWHTALKPAYEPIIVARKPFNGSLLNNLEVNGVGALNIDECRIPTNEVIRECSHPDYESISKLQKEVSGSSKLSFGQIGNAECYEIPYKSHVLGRYPSNVIHDGSEEVCQGFPKTGKNGNITKCYKATNEIYGKRQDIEPFVAYQDNGSASRYFYCAKATTKDREQGLDEFEAKQISDGSIRSNSETGRKFGANPTIKKNIHPTVKPTELMQYLLRLVTPKGGIILDPFMGSGSTGKAAMYENKERNANYKFIGIELTDEYLPIAKARIDFAINDLTKYDKEKCERNEQMKLF